MTPRENILQALRRQSPEYVPWGMDLCESLQERLKSEYGSDSFWEYFQLPYRYIGLKPTKLSGQYDGYYENTKWKPGSYIDEWGIGHIPANFEHFSKMLHPMESFTTPEQVLNFPIPDLLADYRWEAVRERVEAVKAEGLLAVYSAVQVFEPAWYLRGLENMLMDLYEENEMAKVCLERVCKVQEAVSRKLAEMDFDMIVFGDDVGTQQSLMMSKPIWEAHIKPLTARCIAAAKEVKPDILAYYHSDGNIAPLVPDLIEIGVDILNPVQPECMDPAEMKRLYGDRLSFWGTIGTQTTMPFGTTEEVKATVKQMIHEVGKGGGLVLAPTHLLEPEVPMENILTFFETVREYGKY